MYCGYTMSVLHTDGSPMFQIIALVCTIIGLLLLIICIASTSWIHADDFRQGLWSICRDDGNGEQCGGNESQGKYYGCTRALHCNTL